jgi:hypothetical protein
MDASLSPPLTQAERVEIFKFATRGLVHRYGERFKIRMNDADLRSALAESLGLFGGSGSPDGPSVAYTGAGFRIWGGRHTVNHHLQKPLFAGDVTVAMAREVYEIIDPQSGQLKSNAKRCHGFLVRKIAINKKHRALKR